MPKTIIFNTDTLIVTSFKYNNERRYLGLDEYESGEPYADITVNLPNEPCNENQAYIDVNNLPIELYERLAIEEIISYEPVSVAVSGYCIYPLHDILI